MLNKDNRLPGYLIPKLFLSSNTLHSPLFIVKILGATSPTPPKIGFIVSKKISKEAVDRNRVKRLLRQAVTPILKKFKNGQSILIIAKSNIKGKTLNQIKKELKITLNEKNSSQNN
jgi:ribonuclease P protein component